MSRIVKWIVSIVAGAGVLGLLLFAFVEGREELAREREREAPIKVPPRISRTRDGGVAVTIDHDTQLRMGLETAALVSETVNPEVTAYGRLQEDPGASFVVRAPITGIIRAAASRGWPSLGESLSDGTSIGVVEPRLAPIERVDFVTRLSDARGDVEAAEARVSAVRATFERMQKLNADNKNVSDRAVQEAEATLRAEEARLAAARRNVAQLEAASSNQASGTSPISLEVARGGEVVEILARLNESIESGQPVLRVARFDSLLARVDVPAGQVVDRNATMARIVIVGQEAQPLTGQRVSLASSIDPTTLGEGFVFRLIGAPRSLRPGLAVIGYVRAPGPSQEMVVVPYSALVRFAGKAWVYRQVSDDQFSRHEVAASRTTAKGFLVKQGLQGGERDVVQGGQLLLSEEQKAQIQVGEEAEKK